MWKEPFATAKTGVSERKGLLRGKFSSDKSDKNTIITNDFGKTH